MRGVKFGRPELPVPDNFEEICRQWRAGMMSMKEAARICNLEPQTFWYKAVKIERASTCGNEKTK